MTDTSVIDLDSDFMGFWWRNFDVFDHQVLPSFPGYCSLYFVSITGLGWDYRRLIPTLQVIVWQNFVSDAPTLD